MYSFRPNFWEATSHIKRVQHTSARGSTLILNLSDLIPILRVLCFLLLFVQRPPHLSKSEPPLTETPPQLWVLAAWSHNGFGLQVLSTAHGAGAHNMGAHFKSPLRWLFDTSYPHTFIWTLVYTARELRLTNTLWIIFSPKHTLRQTILFIK